MKAEYLEKMIQESGITLSGLAKNLCISDEEMANKIQNVETFTLEEIDKVLSMLNVSNPINFFAQIVDSISTH